MSFFEELTKKATGLLADVRQTTAGSAGDIAGEAAMPDDYGKPIAPVTSFPSYKRTQSPLINNPIFPTNIIPPGEGKIGNTKILPDSMMDKKLPSSRDEVKTNLLGITNDQSKQFFGMDLNQIKASWKDKGGFEGLMSNPGFTLGLAIMSSSAQVDQYQNLY